MPINLRGKFRLLLCKSGLLRKQKLHCSFDVHHLVVSSSQYILFRSFVSIRVNSWLNITVKLPIAVTVDAEALAVADGYSRKRQF